MRNKYCVIGASQSGKTYYVTNKLIPHIAHDSIILCGQDHNLEEYKKATNKKVVHYGADGRECLDRLSSLANSLSTMKKPRETLVIFDDFVEPSIIKDKDFMTLIATCRHVNITIIYVCHSVDIVLTPFMKTNMTHYIICQYTPSRGFSEFINSNLHPIIADEIAHKTREIPTQKALKDRSNELLAEAFTGRYGKLIISVNDRRYVVVKPVETVGVPQKKVTQAILWKDYKKKYEKPKQEIEDKKPSPYGVIPVVDEESDDEGE